MILPNCWKRLKISFSTLILNECANYLMMRRSHEQPLPPHHFLIGLNSFSHKAFPIASTSRGIALFFARRKSAPTTVDLMGARPSTVRIMFEQKPVSVLHLDKYRLFDMSPGIVKYLLLIVHWYGY
jgi:hypothetical protein